MDSMIQNKSLLLNKRSGDVWQLASYWYLAKIHLAFAYVCKFALYFLFELKKGWRSAISRGILGFLSTRFRGAGFQIFYRIFFYFDQLNWFSEHSENSINTQFHFRSQFFEKKVKKPILGTFWNFLTNKLYFIGCALPFKFCIFWHQKRC